MQKNARPKSRVPRKAIPHRTERVHKPLPTPNVVFQGRDSSLSSNLADQTDDDQFTPEETRGILCNPIYAGVPPYPAIVEEETWVHAAAQAIHEQGAEQFLVNLLFMLRLSMQAVMPKEEMLKTDAVRRATNGA